MTILSAVSSGDLSLLFYLVALLSLFGAAYFAYLSNVLGAVLLLVVAVFAVVLA